MVFFFLRRLLASVALVWGVLTLTFVMAHLAPGDPVELMIDPATTLEDAARLRESFGLDQPLGVQYLKWFTSILQGDLGVSLSRQRPVADVLAEAVPITLRLSVLALAMHFTVGTALGVWLAGRRGRWAPRSADLGALVLYALPAFWLGLMLQLAFAYGLRWLPSGGLATEPFVWSDPGPWLFDQLRHVAMPLFVLGLSGTASVARTLRASLQETMRTDFVRTARAKGLPPRMVFFKHALRPASVPLVTLVGLGVPFLLSGAVATEVVFGWPGMGRVTVDAILTRDYPVILATTAVSASLVVLGNLLADIGYALVDPRIRLR
jgi:peptide/nickel transport system permease protein